MKPLDKIYISSIFGVASTLADSKDVLVDEVLDEVPQKVRLLKNKDLQFTYVKGTKPEKGNQKWYNQFPKRRKR
jgi:hypothetical protein